MIVVARLLILLLLLPNLAAAEAVLRRGLGGEPLRFEPALHGVTAWKIKRDTMEGLVRLTSDLAVLGGAAARWEETADGLTYSFILRPDALWSDGMKVTAQHFVDGWSLPDAAISAPDAETVKIVLQRPDPTFLYRLADIYPRHPPIQPFDPEAEPEKALLGNGPFRVVQWKPTSQITLARSPTYWGHDDVALDRVVYLPIEDPAEEFKRFLRGEIDVTADVPDQPLAWLQSQPVERLVTGPWKNCAILMINRNQGGWFKDVRARRALSLAIDRAVIASHVSGDRIKPITTLVGGTITPFERGDLPNWPASQIDRDTEARRLWDSLGKSKPAKLRVIYINKIYYKRSLIAISEMWKKVLGLETILLPMPLASFMPVINKGDYEIAQMTVGGLDPLDYLGAYDVGIPGENRASGDLPLQDGNLKLAQITIDPERRTLLLKAAETHIAAEGAIIPFAQTRGYHFVSKRVRGYSVTMLGEIGSRDIKVED